LLKATDAMAVGFCLKRPVEIRRRGDPLELSSPSSLDNLHRRLTAIALEVVLFEVIPSVSKASRITCCVYLGTRRRYENPDVDAPGVWNEMPRRYGVNILPDGKKRYYRSIRSDGAYPIVAEVLSYGDQRSVKVVVARGAQLAYGAGTVRSEERPRPAHFLADLVTRFCLDESELSKFRSLQSWINRGFLSVADDDFSFLFQACRQARFERDVEALLAVSQARRLERWTKQRMVGILESISGNNFAEFCARVQYTVFFGNLPSSKAEESLRGLLSKEGCRILNLKISSNREGSAVAFVVFSSRAAAEYGIKQLNGVVINGRKIRVNWANKSFLF